MSFPSINDQLANISQKLAFLTAEINNLEICMNTVENPEDSLLLAGVFQEKILQFKAIEKEYRAVLLKFDEEKGKSSVLSFTARKLLRDLK